MQILAFFILQLTLFSGFTAPPSWQNKIDEALWPAIEKGQMVDCIVLFNQQTDLNSAYQLPSKEQKGQFVFQQLRYQAQKSQKPLKSLLDQDGIPYQSLFIINALRIQADKNILVKVAKRAEVSSILSNPTIQLQAPRSVPSASNLRSQSIEWGILDIKADKVWEMGYQGQGVTVGGQDTGVEWDHPALVRQYRGNLGDTVIHDYNWHDAIYDYNTLNPDTINPCGYNLSVPCDDDVHGTHTMGTMVGADTDGNQIGVAPQASWIAVRNMERGYGNPFSYLEAFQWFLAPTDINGMNPDPNQAPHVINNSWYCPALEGCDESNFGILEMAVDALRAAGVVVVTSAGNQGNECSTISQVPAGFPSSFAVGATNNNQEIAAFSSRGPVYLQDSSTILIKPDVAAPGVSVRSASLNGGYRTYSGTSMAGPHVAGTVALMISANPSLSGQVDSIEAILRRTARPYFSDQDCGILAGNQTPNAVYGYGIIDAKAAVEAALAVVIANTQQSLEQINLQLFPNPASDRVVIARSATNLPVELRLLNTNGQLLRQQLWNDGSNELSWELGSLPKGLYFLSYSSKNQVSTQKLVVQ